MDTNRIVIVIQTLILSSILSGCLNNKVKSCQQIITITATVEKQAKENLASQNLSNILKVADSFGSTSQEILEEKIRDQQLAQYSQSLANIYQEYATVTRNFVQAFNNKDQKEAIFYKEEVSRLFTRQQELVNQINDYCQSQ